MDITLHKSIAEVSDAWHKLYAHGHATPYQNIAWAQSWLGTVGAHNGMQPVFALIKQEDAPVALLPMGLKTTKGIKILRLLGGHDANVHMPICSKTLIGTLASQQAEQILRTIAQKAGADAVDIIHQPKAHQGIDNVFARVASQLSPSPSATINLHSKTFDDFMQRNYSKDSRRKINGKLKRLAELGDVRLQAVQNPAQAETFFTTMQAQKAERHIKHGIPNPLDDPSTQAFIKQLLSTGQGYRFYALYCSSTIIATLLTVEREGYVSGMLNSVSSIDVYAKNSPGDWIFLKVIEDCIARGCTTFDFGAGEAHYKDKMADGYVPLYDTLLGITPKGQVAMLMLRKARQLKRAIKGNANLMRIVNKLR